MLNLAPLELTGADFKENSSRCHSDSTWPTLEHLIKCINCYKWLQWKVKTFFDFYTDFWHDIAQVAGEDLAIQHALQNPSFEIVFCSSLFSILFLTESPHKDHRQSLTHLKPLSCQRVPTAASSHGSRSSRLCCPREALSPNGSCDGAQASETLQERVAAAFHVRELGQKSSRKSISIMKTDFSPPFFFFFPWLWEKVDYIFNLTNKSTEKGTFFLSKIIPFFNHHFPQKMNAQYSARLT